MDILSGDFIGKATSVADLLRGAQTVVEGSAPAAAAPASEPAAASGPASVSHVCEHGKRVYKTGNSAKGKWEGYFCPERDRAAQCKPVWVD